MPSFLDPNGFGHTHRAAIRSSCGATLMIDFDLMAHPMETVLREAYAAFGRGDVDGYLQPCTEDFVFSVPGRNGISGEYVGKQGLYDLAGKAMSMTGGTFQEDVEDVLANDCHAVVLARHRFTRDGHAKDYRTAHVYDIRDGKLARCFEQPRDPASFDDAWEWSQSMGRQQGS